MGEGTATYNPPIASEDTISRPSLRVIAVQPLIKLKEEPVATNVEEEPEVAIDPTTI